jgi:hypothetical protein
MQGQLGPWWHKWLAESDRNERVKDICWILFFKNQNMLPLNVSFTYGWWILEAWRIKEEDRAGLATQGTNASVDVAHQPNGHSYYLAWLSIGIDIPAFIPVGLGLLIPVPDWFWVGVMNNGYVVFKWNIHALLGYRLVVGCPRKKQTKISVWTETNQNKICFGFVSVCFVKPKTKNFGLFRYVSVFRTVRHVTGNDKDYLRLIPRVVW